MQECNAKCRYVKKLACKGTLRQVLYLLRPFPFYDPILPPPPYTLFMCMQYTCTYLHREGLGGRANRREKVRGAMLHKAGQNTIMTDCISSPKTLLKTSKDDIYGLVLL
jgi:hypothetical protein